MSDFVKFFCYHGQSPSVLSRFPFSAILRSQAVSITTQHSCTGDATSDKPSLRRRGDQSPTDPSRMLLRRAAVPPPPSCREEIKPSLCGSGMLFLARRPCLSRRPTGLTGLPARADPPPARCGPALFTAGLEEAARSRDVPAAPQVFAPATTGPRFGAKIHVAPGV